ncbi:MAG: hypothetical protein RIR50_1073, partial [Pseudomonadota bacterium]
MKQKPYLTKADVDVLFTRRDDCPAVSASIAQEKAKSSALGRKESKAYEDMINGGRIAYLS